MLRLSRNRRGGELRGAARVLRPGRRAGHGLGLLLRRLLGLLLLLEIRQSEEVLPDQQHEAGEHDGENGVLAIVHQGLSSSAAGRRLAWVWTLCGWRRALLSCTRPRARPNSASHCGNGRGESAPPPAPTEH